MANQKMQQLVEENAKLLRDVASKNRELEIEAALERFRSRMLRMQKSGDLEETTSVMYQQLDALGVVPEGSMVYIVIIDTNIDTAIQWIVTDRTLIRPSEGEFRVPMTEDPRLIKTYEGWKRKDPLLIRDLSGDELEDFKKYIKSLPSFQEVKSEIDQWSGRMVWSEASFSYGTLGIIYQTPLPTATLDILVRFSKDFDLTYTRFLDLQKVEAQSRESQIQLALERVRARTMAMQHSDELPESALLLFQQVQTLGMPAWSAGYCIWDEDKKAITLWMSSEGVLQQPFRLPTTEDPSCIHMREAYERGDTFYVEAVGGDGLVAHYKYMRTLPVVGEVLDGIINAGHPLPTFQIFHLAYFSQGFLLFITYEPVPDAHDIFKRFGKVFEQTYTRFLDLQKAEAQAREAQIELALERVRAKTMAMQKSEELPEISFLLFQQVKGLGLTAIQNSIAIVNEKTGFVELSTTVQGSHLLHTFNVPIDEPYVMAKAVIACKAKRKSLTLKFEGQELKKYNEFRNSFLETKVNFPEDQWIVNISFFSKGWLSFSSNEYVSGEIILMLKRFSVVFDQTYTRFFDLQKAEAQAREAMIEAALERLRSRSMAMHKSDEVMDVAVTVYDELQKLDFKFGAATIIIMDEKTGNMEHWLAGFIQKNHVESYQVNNSEHPLHAAQLAAWREGAKFVSIELSGPALKSYVEEMFTQSGYKNLPDEEKAMLSANEHAIFNLAYMSHGALMWAPSALSAENAIILQRFAKVFEQTYTRFLDLQKAEAQAREAHVQLSMERVRTRTMAMQKSDELTEVAALLFRQVSDLGIKTWTTGFNVWSDDNNFYTDYITNPKGGFMEPYTIDATIMPVSIELLNAKIRGEEFYVNYEEGEALAEVYRQLGKFGEKQFKGVLESGFQFPSSQYEHFVFGSKVSLMFITYEPVPEAHAIFKRFGKVFEQTYTRFLDLKKAEAQAREAQIEAALEKVRSRSLAMHKSEELPEIVRTVFDRLNELDVIMNAASIFIFKDDSHNLEQWVALSGHQYSTCFHLSYFDFNMFRDLEDAREKGKSSFVKKYSFQEKNDWFSFAFEHTDYRQLSDARKKYLLESDSAVFSYALTKNTGLQLANYDGQLFSEREIEVLKRFARVFEQAYIRFLDLQKAEAQAREATRQASLDRVRGQIASMRSTEDLNHITPLIWHELTTLGVPFIRCGVFIIDESNAMTHVYLSSPDGQSLAVLNLPFNSNELTKNSVEYWRKGLVYHQHWNKEEFIDWTKSMMEQGQIQNPETYQGAADPPESLDLHFVPFVQGMLYVGNSIQLNEDEIVLVKSLAEAFSIAYARYEDFTKLEHAKQSIENTLTELKAAQKQLIQSEKM
ncbi:MAG: hypothetical protein ABIO82_02510, partial [Ginsengibacter sp.]